MLTDSVSAKQNVYNAYFKSVSTGKALNGCALQRGVIPSDIHRVACPVQVNCIAGGIIDAGPILGIQGKTNLLLAHGQLSLEGKVFLMLCADIGTDLTIPALIRTLNGILLGAGQVVNVIDIGFAIGSFVGGIHLDRRAVVEVNDLGAQCIAGEIAVRIVRFTDDHPVLFHIQVFTCSDTIGQNIHNADLQFPSTGYRGKTAHYQVSHITLNSYVGGATVVVNPHGIAGGIIDAGPILGIQGKTNLLLAHGQLGLEHNIFLVLCADIGVDLAVPGLVGSLNGIFLGTGQVINVIDICFPISGCRRIDLHNRHYLAQIGQKHSQC